MTELAILVGAGIAPVLAFAGLGLRPARHLRPGLGAAETLALAYVLGTGAASVAILVLRGLGAPLPLWLWIGLAAATAPDGIATLRRARSFREPGAPWVRAVDAASLALVLLLFGSALGPETFWDGFEYHLPIAVAWSEGPLRALPGVLDAELRAGIDLLYVPAALAGRPAAAAAVVAGFAAALAALVRGEARRRAGAGAGSLAGLFTLLAPLTLQNAASSYVDLGVGAFGAVALLAADRWNRAGRERDLLLAALCLGFAANAKLHAAALVPAVLVIVAAGGRPPGGATLLRCAAVLFALTLPWLVKAALTTGNPLFPLFAASLGSGEALPEIVALRRYRLSTDFPVDGPLGFARYGASLFFGSNPHVSGQLGVLPLALLPAAIHRPSRPTAVLAATVGALWVLQSVFMPAVRFAAPLLPLVAIAAAWGGARLARAGPLPARALAAGLALLALHHGATALSTHLPRVASLRSEAAADAYRAATFPDQLALAELVAQGKGRVAIPKGAVLWMPRPVYLLHWERNGELFFEPVRGRVTPPEAAHALLRRRGVGSVVVELRALPDPALDAPLGHPTADAWLRSGLAVRRDLPPVEVRFGRVWVLLDLLPAP